MKARKTAEFVSQNLVGVEYYGNGGLDTSDVKGLAYSYLYMLRQGDELSKLLEEVTFHWGAIPQYLKSDIKAARAKWKAAKGCE